MWWNEVIIAHDLCDTRDYLCSCDFTNVSADSMNNACPHEKKNDDVLHFLPSHPLFYKVYFIITDPWRRGLCVCVYVVSVPVWRPCRPPALITCQAPSSSTSSAFPGLALRNCATGSTCMCALVFLRATPEFDRKKNKVIDMLVIVLFMIHSITTFLTPT